MNFLGNEGNKLCKKKKNERYLFVFKIIKMKTKIPHSRRSFPRIKMTYFVKCAIYLDADFF